CGLGVLEAEEVVAVAELGPAGARREVVGRAGEAHRGGDGDGQQRDDQQVLTPVAPEQANDPTDDRPARRHAPGRVGPAHRPTTGARSDSGPSAGVDWSTTWPSRRKTTRSAHEASWASWV